MKLYKYRSTSKYSLEGLINNEMFFSTYEDFNDPFEFGNPAPDLAVFNKNARKKLRELFDSKEISRKDFLHFVSLVGKPNEETLKEREKTLARIQGNIINIGILCLSEIENNILMWSHYAEDHKGFCIEFDSLAEHVASPTDIINVQYLDEFEDLNDPELLIEFYIIMFCDNKDLPRTLWEAKYKKLGKMLSKNEETQLATAIMGNKYTDWAYEKEVRLVSKSKGPIGYDPKSIKCITFGLRMSESDKKTIKNICNTDDKNHIVFKQAQKLESGYGIKIINL